MVKRQITFTASEELQETIKNAGIPPMKQSQWIEENLVKGLMSDLQKKEKPKAMENLRIKL